MENATKALLIAAAVLLAIMIISLLVMMYNQISSHYQQEHDLIEIEQLEQFNRQFENYNRKGLRGNELISFMNKIIDYNASQSYDETLGYKRILVNIHIGSENLDEFKFEFNGAKYGTRNELILADITNTTGGGNNYSNDKKLIAITGTSSNLIAEAETKGFTITDTQLQQLQSKIPNIIIDEDSEDDRAISNRYYRAQILESLIGWNVEVDENTWKCNGSASKMNFIKEITSKYYQYTKFKRALFDCTEVIYDTETNRIVKMNFEVQTEVENGATRVVFD